MIDQNVASREASQAETRLPTLKSVNIRFRNDQPACGFTGVRSLWFDNDKLAIEFLTKTFPYLHPELKRLPEIVAEFSKVGSKYNDNELSFGDSFRECAQILHELSNEDDEPFEVPELLEFTNVHEIAIDESKFGIMSRHLFRTGDLVPIDEDDDPEECSEGMEPIRGDEIESFCRFLIGPFQTLV